MDFDPDRILKSPLLAGTIGAIVALRFVPGASWPEKLFNVFCGASLSVFTSPAVAEHFGLSGQAMQSAVAFAVGLFGMNFVATLSVWIRDMKVGDVLPFLKRDK